MNVRLLKRRDELEWGRWIDEFWSIALTAASRCLFVPPYTQQDREDVAQQVLKEFRERGIDRCDDDDPESCRRWIWGRTAKRAIDWRRRRRRELRRNAEQQNDPGLNDQEPQGEGEAHVERRHEQQVEPVRISLEGLVDELVAYARLMPGGFTILEEAIFREILIEDKLQREFAQEYVIPIGTVGRLVIEVKQKLGRLLGGEGALF
jgi:DNA-directed RNA polymerase specialized sigma24 family protein